MACGPFRINTEVVMSYTNYLNAMEKAKECEFYTTDGGLDEDIIKRSQEMLGITFSKQCREFYSTYGYLSFEGNEIFGIDPDDDSGELEGNSVAYALNDREELGLPEKWLPIYSFDDGEMAYLDYSTLNEENEPRVIMGIYNGDTFEIEEVLAEDFGDFVMKLIEED